MARSMININKCVFNRLLEQISTNYGNYHLIDSSIQRNVNRSGDDEDWLMHAKINNRITCHLEKEVFALEFNGDKFVVFYDEDPSLTSPFMLNIISKEVVNSGLLTILYSKEGSVSLDLNSGFEDELVNDIFGLIDQRYDISVIEKYFNSLEMWKVDDHIDLSNDNELYKFYSGRMIFNSNKLSLNYSPEALIQIKALLENSYTLMLADKVFKAISSIHWVQAYLEFYRCVEFLYRIPYITEFHGLIQSYDLDGEIMIKLANGLEAIGWKKNEEHAIIKLFTYYDSLNSKLKLHSELFPGEIPNTDDIKMSTRVAKELYKIRNRLVHWRKDSDRLLEEQYNWNIIITELCVFLDHNYDFYSSEIQSISKG